MSLPPVAVLGTAGLGRFFSGRTAVEIHENEGIPEVYGKFGESEQVRDKFIFVANLTHSVIRTRLTSEEGELVGRGSEDSPLREMPCLEFDVDLPPISIGCFQFVTNTNAHMQANFSGTVTSIDVLFSGEDKKIVRIESPPTEADSPPSIVDI